MNLDDTLIIGVGNLYRRDDAAGIVAIRKLKERLGDAVPMMEHTGEGVTLMEAWKTRNRIILVDAVSSGETAGFIHRVDAVEKELPIDWFSCSTHNFGIAEAVELARSLDHLPRELQVIGIEGADFSPGEGLTSDVEHAVSRVVDEIEEKLRKGGSGNA